MLDLAPMTITSFAEPHLEQADALRLATSPDFLTLAHRAGQATNRRFGRTRCVRAAITVTCAADAAVTFVGEPLPELQRAPRVPTIAEIVRQAPATPPQEYHILTGADTGLPFTTYEHMVRDLRYSAPDSALVGFTATDIWLFSAIFHLPVSEIMRRLRAAGLDMLSGRDAQLNATKHNGLSRDEWFEIHRAAHQVGLATSAMLPCAADTTWEDKIDFLYRLRDLRAGAEGVARIALMPANPRAIAPDSIASLRALALSRLICSAVPHIIADCHILGEQNALTALTCGADTLMGTPAAVAAVSRRLVELDLRCATA